MQTSFTVNSVQVAAERTQRTNFAYIMMQVGPPFLALRRYFSPTDADIIFDFSQFVDQLAFIFLVINLSEGFMVVRDISSDTLSHLLQNEEQQAFKHSIERLQTLQNAISLSPQKFIARLCKLREHLLKKWVYDSEVNQQELLNSALHFLSQNMQNLSAAMRSFGQNFLTLQDEILLQGCRVRMGVAMPTDPVEPSVFDDTEIGSSSSALRETQSEKDLRIAAEYAERIQTLSEQLSLMPVEETSTIQLDAIPETKNGQGLQALMMLILQVICDFKLILHKYDNQKGEIKFLEGLIRRATKNEAFAQDRELYINAPTKRNEMVHRTGSFSTWTSTRETLMRWHTKAAFHTFAIHIRERQKENALQALPLRNTFLPATQAISTDMQTTSNTGSIINSSTMFGRQHTPAKTGQNAVIKPK